MGDSSKVTTMKTDVVDLIKDLDYLKCTNLTTLFEAPNDVDSPMTCEFHLATTIDVH